MSAFLTYAATSMIASGISKLMGSKKRTPLEVEELGKKVMEPESELLEKDFESIEFEIKTEEEKVHEIRKEFTNLIAVKKAEVSTVEPEISEAIKSDISVLESMQSGFESLQKSQTETQKLIKDTSEKSMKGMSDLWKGVKSISAGVVGYGTAQAQSVIEKSGGGILGTAGTVAGAVAGLATALWDVMKNWLGGQSASDKYFRENDINPYQPLQQYTSSRAKEILEEGPESEQTTYKANVEEYKYRSKQTTIYDGMKPVTVNSTSKLVTLDSLNDEDYKRQLVKQYAEENQDFFKDNYTVEEINKLYREGDYDNMIAKIPSGAEGYEYIPMSEVGFKAKSKYLNKKGMSQLTGETSFALGKEYIENLELGPESGSLTPIIEDTNKFLKDLDLNIPAISESEVTASEGPIIESLQNIVRNRMYKAGYPNAENIKLQDILRDAPSDYSDLITYMEREEQGITEKLPTPEPVIIQDNSQTHNSPTINMYGVQQTFGSPILTQDESTILR